MCGIVFDRLAAVHVHWKECLCPSVNCTEDVSVVIDHELVGCFGVEIMSASGRIPPSMVKLSSA